MQKGILEMKRRDVVSLWHHTSSFPISKVFAFPHAAGGVKSMHGFLRMQKGILEEDVARPSSSPTSISNDYTSQTLFSKVFAFPPRRTADSINAQLFAYAKRHPGGRGGTTIFITRIHLERPHTPNPILKVFAFPPAAGGVKSMHGFLRMQKGILEKGGTTIFITRIHLERPHIPTPISKSFARGVRGKPFQRRSPIYPPTIPFTAGVRGYGRF